MMRRAYDTALRQAYDRLGLCNYSIPSNRRTWATLLDKAGGGASKLGQMGVIAAQSPSTLLNIALYSKRAQFQPKGMF